MATSEKTSKPASNIRPTFLVKFDNSSGRRVVIFDEKADQGSNHNDLRSKLRQSREQVSNCQYLKTFFFFVADGQTK
jgi:hypothetical protein